MDSDKREELLLKALQHDFTKLQEIDLDTYLTYTNSILPIILLNAKKEWRCLDVGCGDGWDVTTLKKIYEVTVVGVDINKYNNKDLILADGAHLCFKDNSFDAVINILTLPHVKDENEMLNETRRVLKTGGTFLLTLFNRSLANLKYIIIYKLGIAHSRYRRSRYHNIKQIKYLLEPLNFEIQIVKFTNFSFPLIHKIIPNCYQFLLKKEITLSNLKISKYLSKRIVIIAKLVEK